MKIAIAVSDKKLDSAVDTRFGRCPYYLIVDTKTDKLEAIENTAGQTFQGAGVSAAQMIANKGVAAVFAGNFGPKAISVLSGVGIKIFAVSGITAKQALEQYKTGKLKEVVSTVASSGQNFGRFRAGRGKR